MTHRRRWAYSIAIAIALAGIGLKIYQWYHSRTLWLDEEMIFLNIRDRMFSQLAGPLWLDQSAPLGWLALQRTILQTFGTDDRAVRALSVLFGVGTLVCAAWVAVRWMTPLGAALLVLLFSLGQWITYYALEAKPYAADAFFALLLPALAVWATEGRRETSSLSLRRSLVWWMTATVGQWVAYGAIFVAPGCAALLCAVAWRRSGWRRALVVALQGIPWLACFAVHYYLVMRHARASTFLTDFWSSVMPPAGATLGGTLVWLAHQAEPLASHPGGTALWLLFLLAAACGIAVSFRERPTLALSWLLVPLSACVFAVVGLVPLKDRLALWALPALYVAVALAADASLLWARDGLARRKVQPLLLAGVTALVVWPLSADIAERGRSNVLLPSDNHGFDDRSSLRFLMVQRQPGDVLLATHFGLPAVWWYGGISIADPNAGARYPGDDTPILELTHEWPDSPVCKTVGGRTHLQHALAGAHRAAVYLGFDSRTPSGLQELILDSFSEFSRLVSYKGVAREGIVAVFDLRSPPEPSTILGTQTTWRQADAAPRLEGCVAVRAARRW